MHKIVLELLQKSNIKNIDKAELRLQISSHPSYPSLHAITGVLDHFGIENMALDIPQNNEVYSQLPNYFIVQLKNDDGEHIVFVDKKESTVIINYSDKKKEKLTAATFLEQWTGIVVVVDEDELSITSSTKSTKYLKYLPIVALIGVLSFIIVSNTTFNTLTFIHLTLSFVGIYISTLLIKHELGINSETVEKLCTQSEKTSCDAVLNSKGANLFGMFKLNDVSFVYFVTLTLAWFLTYTSNGTSFNTITTLSLLTIPVVLYSVYYQAAVVKKWCPLCLATASVLLCQSIGSYFLNPFNFSFELNGFLVLTISFLSTVILYTNIKPIISSKLSLEKTKVDYYKFKRKFSLFNSLYSNNPFLDTFLENTNEIVFGNQDANLQIVAITNPLCGYCKATHQALDNLLKNQVNDIKVVIRFNINTENKEDLSYKIATALINLYQKDKIACREAMHQVYANGVDINQWLKTYESYTINSQFKILESEKKWCINNNINFTPAVYLNNKEYPKEYDLSDLSFFMEELIEQQNVANKNINLKQNVIVH